MKNLKVISIKDLKKGMTVSFYDAKYLITGDAVESKNFEKPTYIAKCKYVEGSAPEIFKDKKELQDFINYDEFQGTQERKFLITKK